MMVPKYGWKLKIMFSDDFFSYALCNDDDSLYKKAMCFEIEKQIRSLSVIKIKTYKLPFPQLLTKDELEIISELTNRGFTVEYKLIPGIKFGCEYWVSW